MLILSGLTVQPLVQIPDKSYCVDGKCKHFQYLLPASCSAFQLLDLSLFGICVDGNKDQKFRVGRQVKHRQ